MKNLMVSFVLSVVAAFAARAVVLDKAYLAADSCHKVNSVIPLQRNGHPRQVIWYNVRHENDGYAFNS